LAVYADPNENWHQSLTDPDVLFCTYQVVVSVEYTGVRSYQCTRQWKGSGRVWAQHIPSNGRKQPASLRGKANSVTSVTQLVLVSRTHGHKWKQACSRKA